LIRRVEVTALAKSAEDFRLLVRLLDGLGVRQGPVGENPKVRSAEFFPSQIKLRLAYRKAKGADAELALHVEDPDTAFELAGRLGFEVTADVSPEPGAALRSFTVGLPGGTRVWIFGERTQAAARASDAEIAGHLNGAGKRFAVVVSRFNSFITERLLAGALEALARCGAEPGENVEIVRVPGSFEIPSAARALAATKKYDAVLCLGCLLRGDSAHYDVIVNEVARGIGQSAQATGVPHAFGVLTCDTLEQAIDRAGLKMGNKGFEAALAAVEMANLNQALGARPWSRPRQSGSRKRAVKPRSTSARSRRTQDRTGSRRRKPFP
jgi:6,7-dimethyl-8-ribityllumazine synthase